MDLNTADGEKVVFIGSNGWPGEAEKAQQFLTVGEPLTVACIDVSQSSSTVTFVEAPERRFNTVMFKNLGHSWKRRHWFSECYLGIQPLTQEDFAMMDFDPEDMYEPPAPPSTITIVHMEEDEPPEEMMAPAPVKNKIVTMRRQDHEVLSVLNPASEEEAIELFMAEYGYEPRVFNTVWFTNKFVPKDLGLHGCWCN